MNSLFGNANGAGRRMSGDNSNGDINGGTTDKDDCLSDPELHHQLHYAAFLAKRAYMDNTNKPEFRAPPPFDYMPVSHSTQVFEDVDFRCVLDVTREGDVWLSVRGTDTDHDLATNLNFELTPHELRACAHGPDGGNGDCGGDESVNYGHSPSLCASPLTSNNNKKQQQQQQQKPTVKRFLFHTHRQFWNVAERITLAILPTLTQLHGLPVHLSGHSLGGALVTIMALLLTNKHGFHVHTVYTFGSPKVGDSAFAEAYQAIVGHSAKTYRVVNDLDPVPLVPLEAQGFIHVQEPIRLLRVVSLQNAGDIAAGVAKLCMGEAKKALPNAQRLTVDSHKMSVYLQSIQEQPMGFMESLLVNMHRLATQESELATKLAALFGLDFKNDQPDASSSNQLPPRNADQSASSQAAKPNPNSDSKSSSSTDQNNGRARIVSTNQRSASVESKQSVGKDNDKNSKEKEKGKKAQEKEKGKGRQKEETQDDWPMWLSPE